MALALPETQSLCAPLRSVAGAVGAKELRHGDFHVVVAARRDVRRVVPVLKRKVHDAIACSKEANE